MSVERKHFGWKNIKTALPTRRRPLRVTSRLGAKRDLEEDRMRPVAEGEVPRGSGGARNGFASMEGKYNPACEWLEFHYPVAFRTFLNVQKLYSQEMLNPSLLTVIIYSCHLITYPLIPLFKEYAQAKTSLPEILQLQNWSGKTSCPQKDRNKDCWNFATMPYCSWAWARCYVSFSKNQSGHSTIRFTTLYCAYAL
jgi:hypothetical protein